MPTRILIIDDDAELIRMLALGLGRRGFEILSAPSGQEGLKMAYETHPDLIILDIMMPDMDGWQTCERLREISDIPIIMLTARDGYEDTIHGFQVGADDYVTKPFSMKVLEMRIRAVLKRVRTGEQESTALYDDGTLRIDLEQQQVFRQGQMVRLTPIESRLLGYLVNYKGRVVPYKELLSEVWGSTFGDATGCLYLYIHYLRKKLEQNPGEPQYIRTERGIGYYFAPAEGSYEGDLTTG